MKVNPVSKNIPEFIYLATEAITDEFTERKVLEQCLTLGLRVRKTNRGGLKGLRRESCAVCWSR